MKTELNASTALAPWNVAPVVGPHSDVRLGPNTKSSLISEKIDDHVIVIGSLRKFAGRVLSFTERGVSVRHATAGDAEIPELLTAEEFHLIGDNGSEIIFLMVRKEQGHAI